MVLSGSGIDPSLSPAFYADDGVLCPNPFDPSPPTATAFEAEYTEHLTAAMRHLDAWCESSRMGFGAEKSQLVVFTQRKDVDPTPFSSLQLCGFTVAVVNEYKYLGLHLTTRLKWRVAIEHALKRSRQASALIIRAALASSSSTWPAVIRLFVLSFVRASFQHAVLFWGRASDLTLAQARSLQAQMATPLRVCLNLPRTTHQLNVLTLWQVPTVAGMVAKAQLSYLVRAAGLPLTHPTRRLHEASTDRLLLLHDLRPWTALAPSAALPLSAYLTASVVPHLLLDPELGGRLTATTLNTLQLTPCPDYERGVQYWQWKGAARRRWAQANYTGTQLHDAITWSLQVLPRLDRSTIQQIARLHSHAEWEAQHAPAQLPPGAALPPHSTSAPLIHCMPLPGLPAFLSSRTTDTADQQRTRSRMALGRSRTGTVRLAFAKAADAPSINPHCTRCSAPTLPVMETIPHMLLHCPRHALARAALLSALAPLHCVALSLPIILGIRPPPPPFRQHQLPTLLQATTTFLSAIHVDRSGEQLLPLDTG